MIVIEGKDARRRASLGQKLAYVDYLAVAPWNDRKIVSHPRFKGLGYVLIDRAVQISAASGFQGIIGLHSLPQAEPFYRDVIKMDDLGVDADYSYLRYFELSATRATEILHET
jgi:hypothetical protein